MPPAQYDDRQWEALEAILALLKPAVAQLKVLFGERGQADFTEFAHGALEALGSVDDPSDLLLSLDQKISHVLVDEFQDTSLSQFELLTKLTSGWQEGDGRTLFLVGDPANLDEIVPALKEAGVRFRALDIEQLGEKQVVQDLYALTRALLHLGDRIAWLACLRAPWCGLTLADLLALSSGRSEDGGSEYTSGGALIFDKMRDVTHLSADGQKRVDRARSVLAPLVKNRLRGSLRERVEGAWLALGGPACVESETDL